jgi:outer membrane protein TolC
VIGRRVHWAAIVAIAVLPIAAQSQPQGPELSVERAMALAASGSAAVVAKNAAAFAAAKAADAAKARLLPSLTGSLSGAYLPVNQQVGITVPAGEFGTLPLWVPASTSPGTYYSGPFTKYSVELPDRDLTIMPNSFNEYFKGNLTFAQPIFAWGKIRDSIELALEEARKEGVDARGASLDAARQANAAYFSAVLAQRSQVILAQFVGYADQIVADRSAALGEGLATKAELLSAKADRADLASKLVEAHEAEASSREALALLSGDEAESATLSSDFRDALPPIAEEKLKDATATSSTPFAQASSSLAQAERKLAFSKDSTILKPDLNFFASLDTTGTSIPYATDSWTDDWSLSLSLGLDVKVDLFDGGASAAGVAEAKAGVDAARSALLAAGKAARLEARRAIDAARRAQAALEAAQARLDYAAEALRAAESSAAEQVASRSELLSAKMRNASAALDLLEARYTLEEAIADIDRIGGWVAGQTATPEAVR